MLIAPIGTAGALASGQLIGNGAAGLAGFWVMLLGAWVARSARSGRQALGLLLAAVVLEVAAVLATGLGLLWVICHNGGCFD